MKALIALAVAAFVAAPAHAADEAEASFAWHLDFGGSAPAHAGYDLALGLRGAGHFAPLSRVLQFTASPEHSIATIAGVPLYARSYALDDAPAGDAPSTTTESKPFYTRSWFLWTAGGLAATAALISSAAGGGESEQHTLQVQDHGSAVPINGDAEGGYTVCAVNVVPETCANVPPPGGG